MASRLIRDFPDGHRRRDRRCCSETLRSTGRCLRPARIIRLRRWIGPQSWPSPVGRGSTFLIARTIAGDGLRILSHSHWRRDWPGCGSGHAVAGLVAVDVPAAAVPTPQGGVTVEPVGGQGQMVAEDPSSRGRGAHQYRADGDFPMSFGRAANWTYRPSE